MKEAMKLLHLKITNNMICALNPKEGVCFGDSGGPLITLDKNGTYVQIGVVSWVDMKINLDSARKKYKVIRQCLLESPNVFSRVTAQLDWIHKMIKKTINKYFK